VAPPPAFSLASPPPPLVPPLPLVPAPLAPPPPLLSANWYTGLVANLTADGIKNRELVDAVSFVCCPLCVSCQTDRFTFLQGGFGESRHSNHCAERRRGGCHAQHDGGFRLAASSSFQSHGRRK
jgi:hypothetical protein